MAFAFDTLGYAKKLREHGVPQDQAEAHAEAAREFIMVELATRADLAVVRSDFAVLRSDFETLRREVEAKIDAQTLRLTVRLGGLLVAGIAALAAIERLH
jgi:hypothetical protein